MNDYMYIDPRYKDHPGPILDLGCLRWDWSRRFLGEKEVIGVDPDESSCPAKAKLIKAVVSVSEGTINISRDHGVNTSMVLNVGPEKTVESVSINKLCMNYGPFSILKMNIEGGEYSILLCMEHPVADQLVVSFHDTSWGKGTHIDPAATECLINFLCKWYEPLEIFRPCRWVLFKLKGEYCESIRK